MVSEADTKFDTTIGHIEDIIMGDTFQSLQSSFLEKHYDQFEETEENKFIYSDIHQEYTRLVEDFLEQELMRCMPGFSMTEFQSELVSRRDELEGEVFEILLTFSDFMTFKEMMLDYKANKEGRTSVDLSSGIQITPVCVDMSPRPAMTSLCGSGDQNCDSLAAETTANDSDGDGETPDIDLTVVGKALQKQQDEPS